MLHLIVPSLRRGGAEKFTVNLFNALLKQGVDCKLIVLNKGRCYESLIESPSKVIYLNSSRMLTAIPALFKIIIKDKPDKILTMFTHLSSMVLLCKRLGIINSDVYIREVNMASRIIKKKKFSLIYSLAYRFLYLKAELVICQSEAMRKELIEYSEAKSCVINNPVNYEQVNLLSKQDDCFYAEPGFKHIFFVGRITYQKGIDILLDFGSRLDESYRLHIYGKGDKSLWLTEEIERRGLGNSVKFYGETDNPHSKLVKAHRLIISSRYEGFPNIALEALSLGVPIVSVPFEGGRKETLNAKNSAVSDSFNGDSLFDALLHSENISFDSKEIKLDVINKFSLDNISKQYLKAMDFNV